MLAAVVVDRNVIAVVVVAAAEVFDSYAVDTTPQSHQLGRACN